MARYYIKRRHYGTAQDFQEMETEQPKKKKKGFLKRVGGLAMKGAAAYGAYKAAGKGLKMYERTGRAGSGLITKTRSIKAGAKQFAKSTAGKGYRAAKGAVGGMFKKKENKEGENK